MVKPLGYYASGTPLELLEDKFGSRLERLDRTAKLQLMAIISICLANDDENYSLEDAYHNEVTFAMPDELIVWLEPLNNLLTGDLLGLCEALVAQVRTEA